jgi:hypothetical protein
MYTCDYCGRYLKKKYDTCPGCGGDKFTKLAGYSTQIIIVPPAGGYKIKFDNYKIERSQFSLPKWIMIIVLIMTILFILGFFICGIIFWNKDKVISIAFISMSIFFIFSETKQYRLFIKKVKTGEKSINDNMKKIATLKNKGWLIKNVPYEVKEIQSKSSVSKVYYLHVIYEIEKGHTLSLKSEPKHLGALGRENGTVDVLIDPDDYSNYYIDFEIY